MQLAGGGPKFASFAKSGDKIANLATLTRAIMFAGLRLADGFRLDYFIQNSLNNNSWILKGIEIKSV